MKCQELKYLNLLQDIVGTCYDYENSADDDFMDDDYYSSYYYYYSAGASSAQTKKTTTKSSKASANKNAEHNTKEREVSVGKEQTSRLLTNGQHGYPFVSRSIIHTTSSDSNDVVISQTMFSVLIACIFIGMLFGCGCGGIIFYCALTAKSRTT